MNDILQKHKCIICSLLAMCVCVMYSYQPSRNGRHSPGIGLRHPVPQAWSNFSLNCLLWHMFNCPVTTTTFVLRIYCESAKSSITTLARLHIDSF